jgi:hypothetical protein
VYRGTLQRFSKVWETALSLPQGNVSGEKVEGSCDDNPIVLPVDPQEFVCLMQYLFDPYVPCLHFRLRRH